VQESASAQICYYSSEYKSTSASIGAKFLSLISLGLIGSHAEKTGVKYESDGMTQLEFEPPPAYVTMALAQEDIHEYIRSRASVFGLPPPLYMVVGLQIAHGAKFTYFRAGKVEGGVDVGSMGLSMAGIPVDPAIRFRHTTESDRYQTATIDQDFVIAYRLKECKYSRTSSSMKPMYHSKKATIMDLKAHSVSGSDGDTLDEGPEDAGNVITSLGLSKFDLDARALELDKKYVHEILEDDNCDCILLSVAQKSCSP
jgi:hypothetical protein